MPFIVTRVPDRNDSSLFNDFNTKQSHFHCRQFNPVTSDLRLEVFAAHIYQATVGQPITDVIPAHLLLEAIRYRLLDFSFTELNERLTA
jgi:hypothetical protein